MLSQHKVNSGTRQQEPYRCRDYRVQTDLTKLLLSNWLMHMIQMDLKTIEPSTRTESLRAIFKDTSLFAHSRLLHSEKYSPTDTQRGGGITS